MMRLKTLALLLSTAASAAAAEAPWSVRMADAELARHPDPKTLDSAAPKWEYTHGLTLKGIAAVYERTKDEKYWKYVLAYYDGMIDKDGAIATYDVADYNIDRINPGKVLFAVYRKTGDAKYKTALDRLRQQMRDHPRTSEGGFWHKKRYPSQMWLDGLYMGSPFLAQYAKEMGEPALFDDVVKQFVLMERHARDEKTGLLYHGWDESRQQKWADKTTGRSPAFWGRAMGWYAMALVDALEFVPEAHPGRKDLVAILGRLAEAIAKVQDPKTGTFWQVLDQPGREKNYLESSATTMFAYALLKGTRTGVLDAKYRDVGRRAYEGALKEFVAVGPDGLAEIHQVCAVAGLGGDPEKERYRSGEYDYYVNERIRSNDPKAVGPFILASLEVEGAKVAWRDVLEQRDAWYASPEAAAVTDTVLLFQRDTGGWPKNVDMAAPLDADERARVGAARVATDSTIDNGATVTQMRFLARVRAASGRQDAEAAFGRGLAFLLAAQYPNGGWPQYFPLRDDYSRHVTFNDGAMVGVLRLLHDVAGGAPPFTFVREQDRESAHRAAARGLELVLAAQIRVEGVRTAWCAQHDAVTLEPRGARRYEPVSLSGKESVDVVLYLMDVADERADPRVEAAVDAAVEWLRSARLEGIRLERVAKAEAPGGRDLEVVKDPGAPPLWARFYEIGTNRPLFLGRDGIPHAALADIEHERRNGYSWLGPYAARLLVQYPAWKARRGPIGLVQVR
jgi:unsaturated rhamnogalacturonyl hydrolase